MGLLCITAGFMNFTFTLVLHAIANALSHDDETSP
jgi:hypothetical protein